MWVFGRRCTWGSTSRSLYARQWQVSNRKASWERVGFDWNTSWSGSPSPSCGPSWRCYPKEWGREWEEEGWPYCRDTAGWNTGTWTRTSYSYLSSTNYPGNTGCPSITSPFSAIHHQTITVISKVWQVQRWFILEDSCSYILSYIYIFIFIWFAKFVVINWIHLNPDPLPAPLWVSKDEALLWASVRGFSVLKGGIGHVSWSQKKKPSCNLKGRPYI